MTASKMNPANAKNTKGVAKKAIAKAPVEAAAEAKLSVEDSASTGPLGSAFHAQVVSDSDGGQSGGGMGSTALILGGIALAGGVAVAAAGGGKDSVPVPTPTPPQPLPSYSVAASAASVDEGKSITFTITDANKVSGQKVTWSVNPERAADIDGPTSGEVTIDQSGKATVTIVVKADATTEGAETLSFTVGSQNASATINDTSTTPAKTMVLTVNADTGADFVGTGLGDTYNATAATFTALDSLDGAGGTDTLNILDQAGAMAGAAPATVTLKSIEKVNITSVGSIGVNAAAAVTAQAQIRTITPTVAVAGSTSTLTVTYGSVSVTTAALDGTVTAAEVNALVSAAINSIAGSAVSAVVGGAVVVTAPVAGTPLPTITVVPSTPGDVTFAQADTQSNVVGSAAKTAVEYDVSGAGYADVTDLTVNSVGGDNIKAAATQNVTVTNTGGGKVTIAGGLAQTVTQASGDVTLTGATGAVKVTETAQAASAISVTGGATVDVTSLGVTTGGITVTGVAGVTGAITVTAKHTGDAGGSGGITVDGGSNVTITDTTSFGGAITVGNGAKPTGEVVITSNQNGVSGNRIAGPITVKGGTVVNVTENATQASETTVGNSGTLTQSSVTVTGGTSTTTVNVKQTAAVAAVVTAAAVPAVIGVDTVAIATVLGGAGTLANGSSIAIGGLTFTNNSGAALSADKVAAAFANLSAGATSGSSTAGIYTGKFSSNHATGAVGGTTAAPTLVATQVVAKTGDVIGTGAGYTATIAGATGSAATGTGGIANGVVNISNDLNVAATAHTIATVKVDGYANTSSVTSNALSSLSLANGSGTFAVTSTNTGALALTLNKLAAASAITGLGTYTALNITATGAASAANISAAGATDITIGGTVALDLTGSTFTALKTVKVTGSAAVTAASAFNVSGITDVDASGTSGAMSLTLDLTKATYKGSSDADTLTAGAAFTAAAANKAISLGAGDDTLVIANSTDFITGKVDGGAGTDTISIRGAEAAAISGSAGAALSWTTNVSGFEKLTLTGAAAGDTIKLDTIGFNAAANIVTVVGTTGTGGVTLSGFANGETLAISGANSATAGITLSNTAWATGTADSVKIALSHATGGILVATGVETLAITDTVASAAASALAIDDASAKTITIDGASTGLFTLTDGNAANNTTPGFAVLTTVDASTYAGGLKYTTAEGTLAQTVTGGIGDDQLTATIATSKLIGGAGNDQLTSTAINVTLDGGAGNDIITAVQGNTITTGTGNDTVVISGASATVASYATIADMARGDVLKMTDGTGLSAFNSVKVTQNAGATLQNYADAAITAAGGATKAAWFQFEGNTYVVADHGNASGTAFINGQDSIVKINGLVDLSLAVFANNGLLIA